MIGAEVVIVGGGFAGAATAFELARAGMGDVLVLEREAVFGYHASGRNAALGRQITEVEGFTAHTVPGMRFARQPPPGFSEVPLVRPTGSILLCDDQAGVRALVARARAHEVPCEVLTEAGVIDRWPRLAGAASAGGVWFPTDGVLDVHALLAGYVAGARAGGARFELGCEVHGFREAADGVVLETSGGRVAARVVVIAAGAWAGTLGAVASGRAERYAPIRRHLFVTEPVDELDPEAPFVWHVGRREFYVRPEGAGLLVSGCDELEVAPCDATTAQGAIEELAETLETTAPGLAELGVARAWACLRTFGPNGVPVIDWDPDTRWLFWVAGLGGHGATGSHSIGATAAARLLTRLGMG